MFEFGIKNENMKSHQPLHSPHFVIDETTKTQQLSQTLFTVWFDGFTNLTLFQDPHVLSCFFQIFIPFDWYDLVADQKAFYH